MLIHISEYEALDHLSESGGHPAGDIAFMIHGKRDRSHSAIMARTMKSLEVRGLVARLDAATPICWVRTPAGTEALNRKRRVPTPALSAERA